MKLFQNQIAPDFEAETLEGTKLRLSDYKGQKILLSLLRNGSCALCNLRVHELIKNQGKLEGLRVLAVFESPKEDMLPYVGKQNPPFPLIADPEARIYELFGAESSKEKIERMVAKGTAHQRLEEAKKAGFDLIPQERANFFRFPADFLIREDLTIERAHYKDEDDFNHISLDEIEEFLRK
jgi:thioredoxin-dependent peroxiredoxin